MWYFNRNTSFRINNFNIFKQCKTKSNGGGTVILINNKIKYKNLRTYNDNFEAIAIDVLLNSQWITIISMYIAPLSKILTDELSNLFNINVPIILGGDLNGRHTSFGDIANNSIGNIIYKFLNESGNIRIGPDTPSYKNISFIDTFIVSQFHIVHIVSYHIHIALKSNLENKSKQFWAFNFTNVIGRILKCLH